MAGSDPTTQHGDSTEASSPARPVKRGPRSPDLPRAEPTPSHSVLWRILRLTNAAVDRVRVELHGAYAYERLRELAAYEQRAGSRSRSALLALLTPFPCLAVLLAVDALPLAPVEHGVNHQTVGFWFRAALEACTTAYIAILTIAQSVPALPMSSTRLGLISVLIGVALVPTGYVLGLLIGFPVPFVLQLVTPLGATLVLGAAYVSWREAIRVNLQARRDLMVVLRIFYALTAVIIAYTVFTVVFNQLGPHQQTIISCLLPAMKIGFKNWIDRGLGHSPHLKPLYSVFNIDIFHTMFVSSAMQQTASGAALLVIVITDVAQNVIAVFEIRSVVQAVRKIQAEARRVRTQRYDRDPIQRRKSQYEATLGPLVYALHILDTDKTVRHRLDRRHGPIAGSDGELPEVHAPTHESLGQQPTNLATVVPIRGDEATARDGLMTTGVDTDPEVGTARAVLKILFMTEFYVLTEYVEAAVAVTYGMYLYALSYLPNRVYYTQLAALTAEELRERARHVLMYASFELFTLVVFCVAVDRMMDHFSLIGQLGFVLEKYWRLVQILFVFWILYVVQSTLQHLGTDYTFQFQWLKSPEKTIPV